MAAQTRGAETPNAATTPSGDMIQRVPKTQTAGPNPKKGAKK
jgi:hypothetical protein